MPAETPPNSRETRALTKIQVAARGEEVRLTASGEGSMEKYYHNGTKRFLAHEITAFAGETAPWLACSPYLLKPARDCSLARCIIVAL
jgi:hypothetical protein